jgi:hypothetical protein
MKPKSEIDPDFATSPWRSIRRTVARWLLIFAVLSGAIALIPAEPTRAPQAFAQGGAIVPSAVGLTLQQPPPAPQIAVAEPQPQDGFVVMASPSIDPQMVHPAPAGIDEKMVAHLRSRRATPPVLIVPRRNKLRELPVPVRPKSETPDEKLGPEVTPK